MQSNKINCCEKAIALYSFVICHGLTKRKFAAIFYGKIDPIQIIRNAGYGQLLKIFILSLRYNYFIFYVCSFAIFYVCQ